MLSDHEWAGIARSLAGRTGLAGEPWVAVRTSVRTAVLLVPAEHEVHPDTLRAFTAAATLAYGLRKSAAPGGRSQTPGSRPATPGHPAAVAFQPPGRAGTARPPSATPRPTTPSRPAPRRLR